MLLARGNRRNSSAKHELRLPAEKRKKKKKEGEERKR